MNSTTNNLIIPTQPIQEREASGKDGNVSQKGAVAFIGIPYSERVRIWAHNHPKAAIVAQIALAVLLSGAVFGITASLGVPLFGVSILAFDTAFISLLCTAHFFQDSILSKLYDLAKEGGGHYSDPASELKRFRRVALILGPVRFREKLEAELPQEKWPLLAYRQIMWRLKEMGAEQAFFGPLPKFKAYFLIKTRELRCSEFFRDDAIPIISSKEMIFYLRESDLISTEEANCLTDAYEIRERFEWLSRKILSLKTPWGYLEPEGVREELEQICEENLVQSREKRDAALKAVDAAFESVRTKAL